MLTGDRHDSTRPSAAPSAHTAGPAADLPRRASILWYSFCALAGILWLIFFVAMRTQRPFAWGNMFPPDRPLEDLSTYTLRISLLSSSQFYVQAEGVPMFAYPPPAAFLYKLIYTFKHWERAYLALAAAVVALLLLLAWSVFLRARQAKAAALRLTTSILLLSYPMVFAVERGNIEVVLFLFVALGVVAYARDRMYLAAVLLGLAASLKPFPVVLFGLFLARRREWTAFLAAMATTCLLTLVTLWLAGPSIAVAARGFLRGVLGIEQTRAAVKYPANLGFDHSFFSPIKLFALTFSDPVKPVLHTYYLLAVPLAILGFLRVRSFPLLNRLCFLSTVMVALAPISYDYTLIHLYIPMLLLAGGLFAAHGGGNTAGLELLALGLMLFTVLPTTLFGNGVFFFGGQLHALALVLLVVASVLRPWNIDGTGAVQLRGTPASANAQVGV